MFEINGQAEQGKRRAELGPGQGRGEVVQLGLGVVAQVADDRTQVGLGNDDLDLQILWLDLVKRRGPTVRLNDLPERVGAAAPRGWTGGRRDVDLYNAKADAITALAAIGAPVDRLQAVREVCTERDIVLIFDEVFVGFRLGLGGAQEYFGVQADMVTYGKTIGGGLPIGVLAGKADLMKRYRDDKPTDLCFARGTFNSHPYVMASMNEFLRYVNNPEWAAAARDQDRTWNERAAALNERLASADLPVRVRNLSSVWLLTYTCPGRFNWLLQYYLRAEGLALSWVGTGRFIFSHNYTDDDFAEVAERIVRAAETMRSDGWWSEADRLTNKDIRRQVLREILAQLTGRRQAPDAVDVRQPDSARLPPGRAARESSGR